MSFIPNPQHQGGTRIAAPDQTSDLLTIAEAAAYLKVSPVTVKRYVKSGRLRASHLSPRAVRIRRADIERLFASASSEEVRTMPKEQRPRHAPPSDEEIARRRQLLREILAARQHAPIAPLTTAELVRKAREEATWYGREG